MATIKVGMADLNICKSPDMITTLGLGSCIGIALYDPVTKIGGLAHIMLPDSTQMRNNTNIAKFADTGIEELVKRMVAAGAKWSFSYWKCWRKKCIGFQRKIKAIGNSAEGGGYWLKLWTNCRVVYGNRRISY